jgi:hypothetical protein
MILTSVTEPASCLADEMFPNVLTLRAGAVFDSLFKLNNSKGPGFCPGPENHDSSVD